ncbi:MAG TPA: hypothetical protein VG142_14650 [Trebonia sp.]|jgi:hypothetical protein|nr:hypothetical protein [Trebonia sp.]
MLAGNSRSTRDDGGQLGSSLIDGDFGNRSRVRQARRRRTARAAAPLLVPLALALTLGAILAVSSGGPRTTHVNQTTSSSGRP